MHLDGVGPWINTSEELTLQRVLAASYRTGRTIGDIRRLCRALALATADLDTVTVDRVLAQDLKLLRRSILLRLPWEGPTDTEPTTADAVESVLLDASEEVPLMHIVAAALNSHAALTDVLTRVRALGYQVPDVGPVDTNPLVNSIDWASRALGGQGPWVGTDRVLPDANILAAYATVTQAATEGGGWLRRWADRRRARAELTAVIGHLQSMGFETGDLGRWRRYSVASTDLALSATTSGAASRGSSPAC